jgi:hypothetical protein
MCHLAHHPKLLLHRFRVMALFFGEWDADTVEENSQGDLSTTDCICKVGLQRVVNVVVATCGSECACEAGE